MKEGSLDRRTELLKQRFVSLKGTIRNNFKGKKPYRGVEVSREEQIRNYLKITPDVEESLRQEVGDVSYDNWRMEMDKLMMGGKNARL